MFRIAYADIVNKITASTKLSVEEVDELVAMKLEQLSGLISREGAAHIIANEKGVRLFDDITISSDMKIGRISTDMRNVNVVGRVLKITDARPFKTEKREGQVGSIFIGDETGKIRITLWNDQANEIRKIKENDIVKIKNAYVRENNGFRELHLNDRSELSINPKGVEVGAVKVIPPALRKKISELKEDDMNVDLLGTVVQVFNPNFFEVCPKCGKRVKADNNFTCAEHGIVIPAYSYVLNATLDDGSGAVRTAFYRQQVLRLFNVSENDFMKIRDNPEAFERYKDELIGSIVKVIGRARRNPMSNDIDFISNLVFPHPNPEEEMKLLK